MTQSIPFETRLEDIRANVVDIADFNERVVGAYNSGLAETRPAGRRSDRRAASCPPPPARCATSATSRRTSPSSSRENCVGCMECVTQCPDTAILGKVAEPATLERAARRIHRRGRCARRWPRSGRSPTSTYNVLEKKGVGGGKFGIFIDPTKCKGCAECVDACGDHDALKMIRKNDENMKWYRKAFDMYKSMPETPAKFINEKALVGHDAGRALAAVRGRRRVVHGLRRGDGAAHDAGRHRLPVRAGKRRHRGRHRLQHGLHVHVSLQSLSRLVDQFAVRERARRRHGRARALGPDGLAEQAPVDRRRRRRDARHRLPVALAHAGLRHGHQGDRARHAGLLEHRRPGVHQLVQGPGRQDELPRQRDSGQEGEPQGARATSA